MNTFPLIDDYKNKSKKLFDPRIPNYNPNFNPSFNPSIKPELNPRFNPLSNNEDLFFSDFSEKINIELNSIELALRTLNISKYEYNQMDINQLKSFRRIDCSSSDIFAINILIYYKQNSKNLLLPKLNLSDNENFAKIHPEVNLLNNKN